MPSLRVDGWRSGIRFDAAHFIPHHPKCGRLHGHTYALHAEVHGSVEPGSGFILDFGVVKDALKLIADRLDHHVLVQTKSPHFRIEDTKEGVAFTVGGKRYGFPQEDVELLPVDATSAEALAEWAIDELLRLTDLPENVTRVDLGLDETYGKGAWTTRVLREPHEST